MSGVERSDMKKASREADLATEADSRRPLAAGRPRKYLIVDDLWRFGAERQELKPFYDFAAAQARGAHPHPLGRRCRRLQPRLHRAQIQIPASPRYIVGVADGVAKLRPAAANITYSCHDRDSRIL